VGTGLLDAALLGGELFDDAVLEAGEAAVLASDPQPDRANAIATHAIAAPPKVCVLMGLLSWNDAEPPAN
jgi:hypothetical protein